MGRMFPIPHTCGNGQIRDSLELVYLQNFRYTVFQEVVREKSGYKVELQRPPVIKFFDYSVWCSGFRVVNRNLSAKEDSL